MNDQRTIIALYRSEVEIDPLVRSLFEAGIDPEQIDVMTPLPLRERASAKAGPVPFYAVTILAGLVGIGIGLFFAGGTALLYPLMTGGKPIVGVPIVAIISYETMMLSAIVTTFVMMIVAIKRAQSVAVPGHSKIDDGYIMLTVSLPTDPDLLSQVQTRLQQAGAVEIRTLGQSASDRRPAEGGAGPVASIVSLAAVCLWSAVAGCSRDMEKQPSYQPMEAPRLHSPVGSVPRNSRSVIKPQPPQQMSAKGAALFGVNCSHCHGVDGTGDGPVAAYLKEQPADLLDPEVQSLSERALYDTVTYGLAVEGRDVMPSFKGELSAEERRSVVLYVKSLAQP